LCNGLEARLRAAAVESRPRRAAGAGRAGLVRQKIPLPAALEGGGKQERAQHREANGGVTS